MVPGARPPLEAEPICHSVVRVEETHWRRRALGIVVVVALVLGGIGWYRYLTRPHVVVPLATLPAPAQARTPATTAAPESAVTAASAAVPPRIEPVTLSAQDLLAELRADPALTPAQAFDQRYKNQEVTWSGTVTIVSPPVDRLWHFQFKDGSGVRVEAWCVTDVEPTSGAAVTVRGHLASRLNDGFVVDRCQLL